jgi:hypothetical protein
MTESNEAAKKRFELRGLVRDTNTQRGLSGYRIAAIDPTRADAEHLLGQTVTRATGEFVLQYTDEEFGHIVEKQTGDNGPGVVLVVTNRFGWEVKKTAPLMGDNRFKDTVIEIEVRDEDQRPLGPPSLDPFEKLQDKYKAEIESFRKAGIESLPALLEADVPKVAPKTAAGAQHLGAFRLHAELAYIDDFPREAAIALTTKGNIKTREQLAMAQPCQVIRATKEAQADGLINDQFKISPPVVADWIAQARGYDLESPGASMDVERVLADAKRVITTVSRQNPDAHIESVEELFQSNLVRWEVMARARALMDAIGVSDLSELDVVRIDETPIKPGYYFKLKPLANVTPLTNHDPMTGIVQSVASDYHVRRFMNYVGFHRRTVKDSVIIGSVVELTAGKELRVGKDVSTLTIIADELRYDDVNRISYEDVEFIVTEATQFQLRPSIAPPDPIPPMGELRAPRGSHNDRDVYKAKPGHFRDGKDGGRGKDGKNGEEGINGDDVGPAPNVTIYVKRTPQGMPDVFLPGRPGGRGQPGQHGGHGGDGARGRSSEDGFLYCAFWGGKGGKGGNGGDGGLGGYGGVGASGGDLTIITLHDNIANLELRAWTADLSGGSGGHPGEPGLPGRGGKGGLPGLETRFCPEDPEIYSKKYGEDGEAGENGKDVYEASPEKDYWKDRRGNHGSSGSFAMVPLTLSDWNKVFTLPWIVRPEPRRGYAGATVLIAARNITEDTVVLFDGNAIEPSYVNAETGTLKFEVPIDSAGGRHTVQLRVPGVNGSVYSNIDEYRVLPKLRVHKRINSRTGGIIG